MQSTVKEYTSFNTYMLFILIKTSNVHHVQAFNMFMIIYDENTFTELNTREYLSGNKLARN